VEILVTIAYYFLIRLIFIDYKLLSFNLFWKSAVFGFYGAAVLTEIILLGQFTPYSKIMFVQRPVLQMAPEYGGIVKSVDVKPNQPIEKGALLFAMDAAPWQDKVDELTPQVTLAQRHYNDAVALVTAKVQREVELERRRDELAAVTAELADARYKLEHSEIRAPSDGYVINLALRAGEFIRIKSPVMAFVSSEEQWIIALIPQRATGHVKPGKKAQVAFEMYPGKVFDAEVDSVIWGMGNAQSQPSGVVPREQQIQPAETFAVKLKLANPDPGYPLRFGASGLAVVFGEGAADILVVLRRIEIQSEAFLFYLYNPF
jgi:RND family efflux transporter MFP subunit